MKKQLMSLLVGVIVCAALTGQATPINGSIAFNGTPVFNSTPISGATAFTDFNFEYVAPGQQKGTYSSVPNFYSVAFTPFQFASPADAGVVPLWTFTIGVGPAAVVYSFDATSVTANFDAGLNIWNIGGTGIAKITGYDDTVGSWNLSAGNKGGSFFFGSSASVPDGGMTMILLGTALTAMGLIRRKMA